MPSGYWGGKGKRQAFFPHTEGTPGPGKDNSCKQFLAILPENRRGCVKKGSRRDAVLRQSIPRNPCPSENQTVRL